ncbi:MAG TPA: hypothetical protein VNM90_07605 [Haliangium sp.]|nr:hypothetical protein [Haliangium sp.]
MALRRFSTGEMVGVTYPWVTPDHPERVLLQGLQGTVGLLPFAESVHGGLLASRTDVAGDFIAAINDVLSMYNLQHDDFARVVWYMHQAYRYRLRGTPEAGPIEASQAALFPTGLRIVSATYLETAGQAELRKSALTEDRRAVLARIPMQGGTLLDVVEQWNQVGVDMGNMQNQRATPVVSQDERVSASVLRDRWVRVVRSILDVLALEAERRPEARRIIERVDNIRAEVKRRLRAGKRSDAPGDEDGEGAPGGDDDGVSTTPAGESR